MPSNSDKGDNSTVIMRWALDHPGAWEIIIGFENADAQENLEIQQMLKAAGLPELSEMIAIRAYRLLGEEEDSR